MAAFEGNGCIPEQSEFQRGYQAGLKMNEHYLNKYLKLQQRNAELVAGLEKLISRVYQDANGGFPSITGNGWQLIYKLEALIDESDG